MNTKELLAAMNDAFRISLGTDKDLPGMVVATRGVTHLKDQQAVMLNVMNFNKFTEDNDPYGTHEFGSFDLDDDTLFWKIDYYADADMEYGAEDPLHCYRVLTIMLAHEY